MPNASNRALGAANRHTAIMARGRGPTGRMAIGLDGTREAALRVIRHQSSVDSSDSWRMESSYRLAEQVLHTSGFVCTSGFVQTTGHVMSYLMVALH
ncbi:hypothetical protein V8C40DRAFT_237070 [Trichoderma camerunense]